MLYDLDTAFSTCPELRDGNRGLCTINALVGISGEDWATSTYLLVETAKELGFPLPGLGMRVSQHRACLKMLGYETSTFLPVKKTVRTFSRHYTSGVFLLYTGGGGHVVPVVNGAVLDWTDGRLNRIWRAYKVTKED